jgi:hypothetical protein
MAPLVRSAHYSDSLVVSSSQRVLFATYIDLAGLAVVGE